jgi:hypothetical protein
MTLPRDEDEIFFRQIHRIGPKDVNKHQPSPGWWVTYFNCDCGFPGCPHEENAGPFESMQEAADYRDGKIELNS